jgi:oligoribonuclease NrnB/cAMP/cGMP phosphodiesterase (DHH superfamily)
MKCFYHSADLDGHCSGAIVKLQYPDCEMVGINYGQEIDLDSISPGEVVYMVDFCLQPFSGMESLNKICELHWIDHHAKGSIDEAHNRGFLASGGQLLEVGRAGCELTWEYLHGDAPVPRMVYLLGRYDVWKHDEDPDILPFQYGMRNFDNTLPDNVQFWESAMFFNPNEVVRTGRTILDYEDKQNAKFCKAYAFETELNGMVGVCVNKGFTNSKVFDSVYDPARHHMMITFCRLKPAAGKWTVSLYSTRDDVDCGAIAKSYGGGGHKGAAGFQCENLPFNI